MKVCVFGASGPVGRSVVARALAAEHEVVAVTRHPETYELTDAGLSVVGADVHDPASVRSVISGTDAVISTIGVNPTRQRVTTYSAGVSAMLGAMSREDVQRIVCVSSKELDEQGVGDEPALYRFVFAHVLALVNKSIYDDMRRMEDIVRASDRLWTIMRPAGLYAADHVTDYRCPTGHEPGVSTSVADLADALVRAATEDRYIGETVSVLTDDGKPPYLLLLARQASLHRR